MDDASKHLLPNVWTLRAHAISNGQTYKVSYFQVMDLQTIYDWVVMRQWLKPGDVFSNPSVAYKLYENPITGFTLFKDNILPEWEDPRNANGTTCSLRGDFPGAVINDMWNELVLEVVRGGMHDSVLGIQITDKTSRKSCVKFDVWFAKEMSPCAALDALNSLDGKFKFALAHRTVR